MVTRVDKKPIIYNTTLIRVWKPAIASSQKRLLGHLQAISKGFHIPPASHKKIIEDYEDIDMAYRMLGVDDPIFDNMWGEDDAADEEAIRIARLCVGKEESIRKTIKSSMMLEEMCDVQTALFKDKKAIYYGTEAVYQLYHKCLTRVLFPTLTNPNYKDWALDTAKRTCMLQAPYLFLHPVALRDMTEDFARGLEFDSWSAWDLYKKMETLVLRLSSRKNLLAHAYYYGVNKKGFEPSIRKLDDFEIPLTGFTAANPDAKLHIIMGVKYVSLGEVVYALSGDDCINFATMAQCYYRASLYFTRANGYPRQVCKDALALIRDIAGHCCRRIDAGKNFSHVIRSMHILAQMDFNDAYESKHSEDLGWKVRSENYKREARELDEMGERFHDRAMKLAATPMDRLNVGFIYHAFVGDDMLLSDLVEKVRAIPSKVFPENPKVWADFLRFCKAYLLCRFMLANKKKPRVGGDVAQLNSTWAERCLAGHFTMPPHADWGKAWISKEFTYTRHAETWHLEAQDVAYVVKDSEGIAAGKYRNNRVIHSELLMAMTSGNVLDILTGSTPKEARERIKKGDPPSEVVLTTAPKAENAKPTWKKRVTFAADCEFRKMQAEYDRNCRKIMSFIRGPSLGVDQCILEKQFHDIALSTGLGTNGTICSHDISAWSESMDRRRKFEFEKILTDMLAEDDIRNIMVDWSTIKAVTTKQGAKDITVVNNGSFQGFDGSASTILHSLILIYCMDTARRAKILDHEVKTNMATLIDDCIALMNGLTKNAIQFWDHLKKTYLDLGFVVDDLKSIFSSIKAIYLSRRFVIGGEVPADLKIFLKAHSSYEDPLRCSLDVPGDIFGSLRGAADANGEAWYIYFTAVLSSLCEIAHSNNVIMKIPPAAAAIFALAPSVENGWAFPSILDWGTNDIVDKRGHFNALLEKASSHDLAHESFRMGIELLPRTATIAIYAIKSQAWRLVSVSSIFTSPFDALRDGPLKPEMLKRNAVQDILLEVATAAPWKNLLGWHTSDTTIRVRELLIGSGHLHAPTLAALVNCMPDNFRLSLIGKAVGSSSLLELVGKGARGVLKRRVINCSKRYFEYSASIYSMHKTGYSASDIACLSYYDRTVLEREEFYTANQVQMTDHTFPDPVGSLTRSAVITGSIISPNSSSLRIWDPENPVAIKSNELIANKGTFVPRRSGRVWEVTGEYAKGWDTVSQRIVMGLAVLARAQADGHRVEGLLTYFTRSWNEFSNITPRDTHLISIHGSIKRLDANPGSATHPIIFHRNLLMGFNNKLKSAIDAIKTYSVDTNSSPANLHDPLAHESSALAATCLAFCALRILRASDISLAYHIAMRPDCIAVESRIKMTTDTVSDLIEVEIMESAEDFGLLQACPELVAEIAIPTMKATWVEMINALMDGRHAECEAMRREMEGHDVNDLLKVLKEREAEYVTSVVLAAEPAMRGQLPATEIARYAMTPLNEPSRLGGDDYTMPVRTMPSRFTHTLSQDQPDHIAAAIAIKSVVWSRLKQKSAYALAQVLHNDTGASTDVLRGCTSIDFWRGVVGELSKAKRHRALSEAAVLGFRSLGVSGIHLAHSEDSRDVTHAVSSYFGANIRDICVIVSDEINSIAGRKASDYARPLLERIITNNPSMMNLKLRKDHTAALLKFSLESLPDRMKKIKEKKIKHRGDIRACEVSEKARLVELKCRLLVYQCSKLNEFGGANVSCTKILHKLEDYVQEKCNRLGINIPTIDFGDPPHEFRLEDVLEYMDIVEEPLRDYGWDTLSGKIGVRYAYNHIISDSDRVIKTQFAVSAAEIAPRIHKKVIITPADAYVPPQPAPAHDQPPGPSTFWGDEDDGEDLMAMDDDELDAALKETVLTIPIPLWQALFTCTAFGTYTPQMLNDKLGTELPDVATVVDVRNAHLEDFTDSEVKAAFPNVIGDYVQLGTVFDEEWLERDESDAYTTDELGRGPGGHLF